MQDIETDIAIVGGGMVGLSLACALARTGLSLVLIDRQGPALGDPATEPLPWEPRVSALTTANLAELERLGLRGLAEHACPFRAMEVWDGEGTGRVRYEAADLYLDSLGSIVENSRLVSALQAVATRQENLRIVADDSLADMVPETEGTDQAGAGQGRQRLTLTSGQQVLAALVVGADGASSRVRELAGFRVRSRDYGQHAIVTTVATEAPHQYTAWQRFMATGPLAFLPLLPLSAPQANTTEGGPHCASIVWSCTPALHDELMALDDADFMRRLGQAFEHTLGGIQQVNRRYSFPLRQMHARDYVKAGVALVGDAAHTIHPLAGQGVNLGLRDAWSLAEVIHRASARHRDFAHVQVLSAYQRRRKGENLAMMAAMEGFKRLFGQEDLLLRWLRNTGMTAVERSPVLKRSIMAKAMGL